MWFYWFYRSAKGWKVAGKLGSSLSPRPLKIIGTHFSTRADLVFACFALIHKAQAVSDTRRRCTWTVVPIPDKCFWCPASGQHLPAIHRYSDDLITVYSLAHSFPRVVGVKQITAMHERQTLESRPRAGGRIYDPGTISSPPAPTGSSFLCAPIYSAFWIAATASPAPGTSLSAPRRSPKAPENANLIQKPVQLEI
jgi:hypothetical protein